MERNVEEVKDGDVIIYGDNSASIKATGNVIITGNNAGGDIEANEIKIDGLCIGCCKLTAKKIVVKSCGSNVTINVKDKE